MHPQEILALQDVLLSVSSKQESLCGVQVGQNWNKARRKAAEEKLSQRAPLNVQHTREQMGTDYDEVFCFL